MIWPRPRRSSSVSPDSSGAPPAHVASLGFELRLWASFTHASSSASASAVLPDLFASASSYMYVRSSTWSARRSAVRPPPTAHGLALGLASQSAVSLVGDEEDDDQEPTCVV